MIERMCVTTLIVCGLTTVAIWGMNACADGCITRYRTTNDLNYKFTKTYTTPDGIHVDDSGLGIPPSLIDRLVQEVDDCLAANFDDGLYYVQRECLRVKIAKDCLLSLDGTQELLPVEDPPSACRGKEGFDPDIHVCRPRAGVQGFWTIVTCPSLYLFKDPLLRITTGRSNPWTHELMSECAQPSTEPLSGLVR